MLISVTTVYLGLIFSSDFRSIVCRKTMQKTKKVQQVDKSVKYLIATALFLYVLHLLGAEQGLRIIDLDRECSLGTVYSAFLLLLVSLLCFSLSKIRKKVSEKRYFSFLTALFAVISMDELQEFHRQLPKYLVEAVTGSDIGYTYGNTVVWVAVLAPIMIAVFIMIIKYSYSFFPKKARWYALAGVIFWGVAVALEGTIGVDIIPRTVESGLEEVFEMLGTVLFGASASTSLQIEQKESNAC